MKLLTRHITPIAINAFRDAAKANPQWKQLIQDGITIRPDFFQLACEIYGRITGSTIPLPSIKPEHLWAHSIHQALTEHSIILTMQRNALNHPGAGPALTIEILQRIQDFVTPLSFEPGDIEKARKDYVEAMAANDSELAQLARRIGEALAGEYKADAARLEMKMGQSLAKINLDEISQAATVIKDSCRFLGGAGKFAGPNKYHDGSTAAQAIAGQLPPIAVAAVEMAAKIEAAAGLSEHQSAEPAEKEVPPENYLGTDPAEATPEALAMLGLSEEAFYIEASEGELQSFGAQATAFKKGPAVILLDVSGSTEGGIDIYEKGVMLLALQQARKAGRNAAVIAFNAETYEPVEFLSDEPSDSFYAKAMRLCCIEPKWGTNYGPALSKAFNVIDSMPGMREAVVLLLSDGQSCKLEADILTRLQSQKATLGTEVHGLMISDSPFFLELDYEGLVAKASTGSSAAPEYQLKQAITTLEQVADHISLVNTGNLAGCNGAGNSFFAAL